MLFVDDYKERTRVTYLKEKLESFEKIKAFKTLVENEIDLKITYLRINRGELTSHEFNDFYEHHEIRIHFIIARNP